MSPFGRREALPTDHLTRQGDSGGPNVCYDAPSNRWHLFGLVSYGPTICDRPDESDKWLTVSVDLTNYRSWIQATILAEA